MKIRNGFVSNSSSSSFVILSREKPNTLLSFKKIPDKYKYQVIKFLKVEHGYKFDANLAFENDLYLTRFVGDCEEENYAVMENKNMAFSYVAGSHCDPYNSDHFKEIDENIWVLKNKFSKQYIEEITG